LSGWHPADLAGAILDAVVSRADIDPKAIKDVIMGCVTQSGEQSGHVGRNAVLASSLPDSVPAVTIDRQCGSSQQAVQFAAQAIKSGMQDIVIAAGVESMSRVPIAALGPRAQGTDPLSEMIKARYKIDEFSQFTGAEMVADKYRLRRDDLDNFALTSHVRASAAARSGGFSAEIACRFCQ
jgi:acetyl-CoA C-acetyltransferase